MDYLFSIASLWGLKAKMLTVSILGLMDYLFSIGDSEVDTSGGGMFQSLV